MADIISQSQLSALRTSAEMAAHHSYAPYSKFAVGAAVLTSSGSVFLGCNVENASYGLTTCAERTAVFAAVAAGERSITAIAIYTPTPQPTTPCGACRQVLWEFGPDAVLYSFSQAAEPLVIKLSELLPHSFGPKNLG